MTEEKDDEEINGKHEAQDWKEDTKAPSTFGRPCRDSYADLLVCYHARPSYPTRAAVHVPS